MGKKTTERIRSKTLPSSPTHSLSSSSSSDFEFRISSISPRKSSAADELFYKGQLLPLHRSPRISMVRTLLLASSSSTSSSSDITTTASRDSSSSNDSTSSSFAAHLSLLAAGDPYCESSRPSSVTDDDKDCNILKHRRLNYNPKKFSSLSSSFSSKYFSLSRFSNVFRKLDGNSNGRENTNATKSDKTSVKKISSSAKDVIIKSLKKVKPFYEKLSSKQYQFVRRRENLPPESTVVLLGGGDGGCSGGVSLTQSFSGNLKCARRMIRRSCVASCPSSMRSSPSHSGVLSRAGLATYGSGSYSSDMSTMEELQNAMQGAIAHCKNSLDGSK